VNTAGLAVARSVIEDTVRSATAAVPGVAHVHRGSRFAGWFGRPAVSVRVHGGAVRAQVHVIARSGEELRPLAAEIRTTVAAVIERVLDLQADDVTVVIDGVGR